MGLIRWTTGRDAGTYTVGPTGDTENRDAVPYTAYWNNSISTKLGGRWFNWGAYGGDAGNNAPSYYANVLETASGAVPGYAVLSTYDLNIGSTYAVGTDTGNASTLIDVGSTVDAGNAVRNNDYASSTDPNAPALNAGSTDDGTASNNSISADDG